MPGVDRNYQLNELIIAQGGLTPLLYAVRQGYQESTDALLKAGADINQPSAGDSTSPLLMAVINGHFDLAKSLLEKGANPNTASANGVTPLYGVLNVEWAPKALYPQPRAHMQQKTGYLDLMKQLIDKGADPNARLKMKVWYSGYSFDLSGVDEIGASVFWRAAYASDVAAMRLLVAAGADPNVPTMKPAGRARFGDMLETREVRRPVRPAAGADRRPVGDAAAGRRRRRLRRRLRRQLASLRADRHARRREVPRRRARRRRQRRRSRRQHRAASRRVARRQRNDSLPGVERRQREGRRS